MSALDNRKYPDRLANARADFAVIKPLAESCEHILVAFGFHFVSCRERPYSRRYENGKNEAGNQTTKNQPRISVGGRGRQTRFIWNWSRHCSLHLELFSSTITAAAVFE